MSKPAINFIKRCVEKDPAQRPSAAELLEHPWMKQVFISNFQPTDFNRAFANVYTYSKVDSFQSAISSYVAKMLIKPEDESVLRRIFENPDHDKKGTLDE